MNKTERIIDGCFETSKDVRYVAIYLNDELTLRAREGLSGASSSDSDRFEELLVNPALLKLTSQRGNIDCGGLKYLLIRYGNFVQFVYPLDGGHVSIALESSADLVTLPELLITTIKRIL